MSEGEFRCRICGKPTKPGEKWFPFCSDRCKLIDLGAWADERYRITRPIRSAGVDPDAEGDEPPSDSGGEGSEPR